jgi:hypothetical protein
VDNKAAKPDRTTCSKSVERINVDASCKTSDFSDCQISDLISDKTFSRSTNC